jgi:hypothetical protein
VGYRFPVESLGDVSLFNLPLRLYPVHSRVYQDLLTISYLAGSRDPVPDLSTAELVNVKVFQCQPSEAICT